MAAGIKKCAIKQQRTALIIATHSMKIIQIQSIQIMKSGHPKTRKSAEFKRGKPS